MNAEGSVTQWIADLALDDADKAQEELWKRYFHRLVSLARLKLGDAPRGAADEEDVAVCALNSFFGGAAKRRFPQLKDRDSLWPLLAKITSHKAIDQRRRQSAKKQGGGHVRGNSAIFPADVSGTDWTDALLDEELRPDFLVAVNEQCQRLMDRLPDDRLREIARLRLEGYTNAEIASRLGVVQRTIERKVDMIRDYWQAEIGRE
jgi:DNA-directed RNA polymerase specialized sigma24 family protein